VKPDDFKYLSDLLKSKSGLSLTEDKTYLVESRLMPVVRRLQLESLEELVGKLRLSSASALVTEVVEAMTTNETFFFRDKTPFTHLEEYLLPLLKDSRAKEKKIRVWCCAASTGQEPYSIAMVLDQHKAKFPGWRFEIIATDIATHVLDKAKEGFYNQFEVQRGLPVQLMVKYFKKQDERWAISDELKSMVRFQQLNLLQPFSSLGQFDIIFCRNVLIYFDEATKADIMSRLAKQMPEDGHLLLGAAETVMGYSKDFEASKSRRGLYGKTSAAGTALGSAA